MTYQEIIKKIEPELDKVTDFFEKEMAKIRTSHASPSLIEDITVECFGQKFLLKQLATISTSGPRQIIVQPWDKSYIEAIEKAIFRSSAGLTPIVEKETIRISLPILTQEYRKDLLKVISEKQEEARRTVRRWREDAWREIQQKEREGEISEDDKFRGKDELQKLIDKYNERIEETGERKKKEIEL